MQFVIGGLVVFIGLALIISGAEGSGGQLFAAVTGKEPANATAAGSSSVATALLGIARANGIDTNPALPPGSDDQGGPGELGPGSAGELGSGSGAVVIAP